MQQAITKPIAGRATRADYFASGGFDENVTTDPMAYAARLCRYISDASTVRVRVLSEFGRAPSVEQIRAIRENFLEERAARIERLAPKERLRPEKPVVLKVVPAPEPEPAPEPVPTIKALSKSTARPVMLTGTEVLVEVARHFGVSIADITGSRRTAGLLRARNLAAMVFLARGNGYSATGRLLNRDHTTILNSEKRFFSNDLNEVVSLEGWLKLAPCWLSGLRTVEEFRAVRDVPSARLSNASTETQ